jgi:hypothetical protein
MAGNKLSLFKQIANRKGWTFNDIGERWDVSERQMSRVANSGKQKDIDAVNGLPDKLGDNMNELATYLGLTDDQYDELDPELQEDMGHSGEMLYSYWFYVPEHASSEILEVTGWRVGQLINGIPTWVVDNGES